MTHYADRDEARYKMDRFGMAFSYLLRHRAAVEFEQFIVMADRKFLVTQPLVVALARYWCEIPPEHLTDEPDVQLILKLAQEAQKDGSGQICKLYPRMNPTLEAAAARIRADADMHLMEKASTSLEQFQTHAQQETLVEHRGQTYALALSRLALDQALGISTYVLFIRACDLHLLSDLVCDQICRAIYDVEWKEGPLRHPGGLRWFIRVRKEDPHPGFPA